MRGHWGALIDRGLNPRLLRTGGDHGLFEYCLDLMLNRDLLRNLQLKLTDANAVLWTVVLHAEFMQTLTRRSICPFGFGPPQYEPRGRPDCARLGHGSCGHALTKTPARTEAPRSDLR